MTTATMTSIPPTEYQPSGHLDSVKARARDLLTCALCVKSFTDPRVLPCQHSFCRLCLQTYIDNVVAAEVASRAAAGTSRPASSPLLTRRRTVGSFACPACHADVGLPPAGASAFPVDERIQRIRELAIDEMARNISKRLGIARVASAPDNENFDVDNNNKDKLNKNGIKGQQHYATVGRQFSWSSSRLGNIDEVTGIGGDGGRFGTDCINEDDANDYEHGWESSVFDGRTRGGSALFDRFGRRKIGYSSMRESRHSYRPSLDSLCGSTESENIRDKTYDRNFHDSDNDIRFRSTRADLLRNENGSGNDIGNERSFGRSKPLSEQFRASSQTEFSDLPTTTTLKASVSTSSAFRNPYGDNDDLYIPVIGRHRGSQPLLSSSSLRERRRRAGFDLDGMFDGGADVLKDGGSQAVPDTPDGWRRFYVANVGGDFSDFMERRQQNQQKQHRYEEQSDGEQNGHNFSTENGSSSVKPSVDSSTDKISSKHGESRLETSSSVPGSLFKIQEGIRFRDGQNVKVNNETETIDGGVSDNKLTANKPRGIFATKSTENVRVDSGRHRDANSMVAEPISSDRQDNLSASLTQSSSGVDGSPKSNVMADKANPPLSPQRPISPSKDSCFSRLTKFRQTSVGSPRLRSKSSATSTGSEESGLPSPGPESSPTRLNADVPEKSVDVNSDGSQHEAAKLPSSSGGANKPGVAKRPLTKDRVRKRPSLFVGARLDTPVDSDVRSATVSDHSATGNSGGHFDTVFSAGPMPSTITRQPSTVTSDKRNGNDASLTPVPVCGQVPGGAVIAGRRQVNGWTTDDVDVSYEVPADDEKWEGSEPRVTSTSGTSGIGSMSDDHSGSSCPLTPASTVSPGLQGLQTMTDAVNRRTIEGDVFNKGEHGEPIKQELNYEKCVTNDAFRTTIIDSNPSSVHPSHTVFNHQITIDNQPTADFSNLHDNRGEIAAAGDVWRQHSDISSSSAPIVAAEAVDEALFELDSVLDMHVDDHPPSVDCASVSENFSSRVAPLAACDDSDDLNVALGGIVDRGMRFTLDGNNDINEHVQLNNDEHDTRTEQIQVSLEPGRCEAIDDSGKTLEPEIGATLQNGAQSDTANDSTCDEGDADRDKVDVQQINQSRKLNDDSSSLKETPEITIDSDHSPMKTSKTHAEFKPETKSEDIQHGTRLKTSPQFEADRHNDAEEFNTGYVMATGVTSLSDGSLIVADYGAGCLCLFPSGDEEEQDNDDDNVTRESSDVKRDRVQYRLSGLKPFSVATNFDCLENDSGSAGLIYVGDRRRKTISVFDRYLSDVAQWPDNRFDWICGITQLPSTDAGASIVVIDRSRPRHQLVMYTADGRGPIVELGPHGNGDTELCMAEFVTVDRQRGRVIVADSGNHCLKTFDPRSGHAAVGRLGGRAARRGAGDGGEMQWPKGLAIDEQSPDGVVYVADSRNGRVLAFDAGDGRCIGTAVSGLRGPYAVAVVPPSGGVPLSDGTRTRLAVTAFTLGGQSEVRIYDVSL